MFKIGGISRQLSATEKRFFRFPDAVVFVVAVVLVVAVVVLAAVTVLFVVVALVDVDVIFRICEKDFYAKSGFKNSR